MIRDCKSIVTCLARQVLVLVLIPQTVAAQGEPGGQPATNLSPQLSLAQAQRIAFERNWDLLAAKSDVDIATAQRLVAREFPNPTASFGITKISVDSAYPNSGVGFWSRSYDTIAAVSQLVEIGGKRKARQDSAAAGARGAAARLADARRLLDQGVTQAYVAAVLAERNREVLTNSAASLRQEASIAEIRERAGDISTADRSQIEIAARRLELDAEAAATTARNARVALEVLLGVKRADGGVQLSDSLEPLAEAVQEPTNRVAALMNRPDVVAAESARARAEADLRSQQAQRIPDPTFFAQYEHEPPDLPNTVGFGVSFPLPLWNRNKGNISAARATLEQTTVQAEKVRAQAAADVVVAQNAYDSALSRWQHYRDELTGKSHQVLEAVAYAYRKGGASLVDLLTAQRNDNDIRLATAQAAADAASAAAALKAAAQVIGPYPSSQ
jgi:outer membrane protein, heavy metal efflux system